MLDFKKYGDAEAPLKFFEEFSKIPHGSENTAKIANLAYLTPFLSLVVSAVFLDEKIQLRALIALFFIIGGIFLQNIFSL